MHGLHGALFPGEQPPAARTRSTIVHMAAPVAPPPAPPAPAPEDLLAKTIAALSPDEMAVCARMNVSPVDFARQLLSDAEARAAAIKVGL